MMIRAAALFLLAVLAAAQERIPLTITGGHDLDSRDHGRPVALIGAALGVPPDVFREAFSRVTPAPGGAEPEPAEVSRNKAALLDALSSRGVTNDQLDRVSDYYRYRPDSGRLWPTTIATGYMILKDGAAPAVTITNPGSGYTTPPEISVAGHPEIKWKAALVFTRDLKTNGSIASIR